MKNVLVLKSSILAGYSQSNQLSDYFVSKLNDVNVIERDIAAKTLPYFDGVAVNALRGQPNTDEDKALLALSDELVAELKNADVIVFNAPMYNFNIPAQLKSYFDFIARPGVTFQYSSNGPEGLVKGKKAIVITTTGGMHKGQATDIVASYMKIMLGFVGITDVQFVYAEGFGLGEEAVTKAQTQAKAELDQIASTF
ncbi:FMN-dependent NADH-azoreductase [Pasteurella canis]|uniref:FMN dependent NADH:quinone oxidoreductase n=1 Tax=Pasteurella canis TaxID=753 RepID=A0ABQ4VNH7_9PAST|nr:FMN-dependent NADH-azoreductase [Pasteurella canis]MXN87675.1 FMN-dependent NADH-azoreductase [Pasteurella canis]UAX42812.1 FMN-dependent NADH-azoreductase [Pasteurella canis]UEA17395.1 FMN-dependent NADH-azoreductase [Pasteurella canis]UEC23900.1 FMN-dependent NADH-azoreductase [Pasteurella canis]GJH43192.1 FMN-dependent NADH-azoreductase [Pasteurella canis]